jgi:hypothetical protein
MVTITLKCMPVFEPNDYFWQNHWDGQEPKWVAYARAVRQIIANEGGFKLYDKCMEDKMAYKKLFKDKA